MKHQGSSMNSKNSDEQSGAKILVIDDEEVVHVSLKRILGRKGHEIEATLNAHEGLDLIENDSFDMVITDLMMPEMNGIDLLKELKDRGIQIPVLMITGYPTIKTALQALRLGAVDYLAKPFTRTELLAPVNRILRRQAKPKSEHSTLIPAFKNGDDKEESDMILLEPGDRYHLRRHSWVVYQQDGTVVSGIVGSFLNNIGSVESIQIPDEADVVEQGYVGIKLKTESGEEHGVLMPLSGRVISVNSEAVANPKEITPETWIVMILPDRLQSEIPLLVPG